MTNGTDKALASKFQNNLASNKHFKQARKASEQFVVVHYAGPVEYDPICFVEKNADPIDLNITKVLSKSTIGVIAHLFKYDKPKAGAKGAKAPARGGPRASVTGGNANKIGKQTICVNFSAQLDELVATLGESNPRYVRCIKPNNNFTYDEFNSHDSNR
jgi:myosin-5